MSQESDLGEVEIDFISFVPRGANRKKYFLLKEDRALKDDILKSILETDEGDVSRVLKEAGLEGEASGFWRQQPSCSRPIKTSCRMELFGSGTMSYLFTLALPSFPRRNDDLACLNA